MKNTIIKTALLALLTQTMLQALTPQEIDIREQNINRLDKVVSDKYGEVRSVNIESIYRVLNRYSNPKAELVARWFQIATTSSSPLFVAKTKRDIRFYLDQLLLASSNAMSQDDYMLVKRSIKELGDRARVDEDGGTTKCRVTTNLNLRDLPIISKLTKKMIIQEDTTLEVLYRVSYITRYDRVSHWGYVQIKGTTKKGWVNLKHTNIRL